MIRQIALQNFKAVGEQPLKLDLAPLTLLLGPNGSGKTSVQEAIALLTQSAADPRTSGLILDGPLVRFTSPELVFHNRERTRWLRVGVTVDTQLAGLDPWWREESQTAGSSVKYEFGTRAASADAQFEDWEQRLWLDDRLAVNATELHTVIHRGSADTKSVFEFPTLGWTGPAHDLDRVLSSRMFNIMSGGTLAPSAAVTQFARSAAGTVEALAKVLKDRVIALSGTRGAELFVSEVGDSVVSTGLHGESTVRLISLANADGARRKGVERLIHWAGRFGLDGLTGGWVGRNELSLTYADPTTGTTLPIGAAGGGSQRILPFVVDCFASLGPRVLLADEIEQGLHPEWQVNLAELFAEAVTRGHQIIAATQSPTLVLAVCAAVAKGLIAADQVALYGMERGSDGEAVAVRQNIRPTGWIEGGWIRKFADVEQTLLQSFLNGEESADGEDAAP